MTKEVIYFDIPELTSSLKRAKQKKLLPLPVFKYIEILETKIDGSVKTVLKGRKEDLESLPLTAFQIGDRFGPQNLENLSYVEIILHERNARLPM